MSCCNKVLPIYDNTFLHKNLKQVLQVLYETDGHLGHRICWKYMNTTLCLNRGSQHHFSSK